MASGMGEKPSVGESKSNSSSSIGKPSVSGKVAPFPEIMAVLVF